MKRILTILVAFVSLTTSTARAEDLMIGHTGLRLGMPQDQLLKALSKEFEARQVSVTEGKYLLRFRRGPHEDGGSVSFRNGKLYRASKTWGETPTLLGAPSAVDGLVAALTQLSEKGWRSARVRAETLTAPGSARIQGSVVKLVTFELAPDRTIVIQVNEPLNMAPGDVSLDRSIVVHEFLAEQPGQ